MNELTVFKNNKLGDIRAIQINNQPWFVGKDIADILGYSNTIDAINTHVDKEDRKIFERSPNATFDIPNRGMTIINESGLYSLILSSKLPKAKEFKRWVTSEVLPQIRKTGGYIEETISEDAIKRIINNTIKEFTNQIPYIVSETIQATIDTTSSNIEENRQQVTQIDYFTDVNIRQGCQNKIYTFPKEIIDKVNEILTEMKIANCVNYSMVARICTMSGYSITSPSVKRYYDNNFK